MYEARILNTEGYKLKKYTLQCILIVDNKLRYAYDYIQLLTLTQSKVTSGDPVTLQVNTAVSPVFAADFLKVGSESNSGLTVWGE